MLLELPKENYNLLYNINDFKLFPLISSVIFEKQSGKIFVDNMGLPNIVYIIHKSGFSYLYNTIEIDYSKFIKFIYNLEFVPLYSHLYNASSELIMCAQKEPCVNLKIRQKMRMNGEPNFDNCINTEIDGYSVKWIDNSNIQLFSNSDLNFIDKFWDNKNDFLDNGFAWAIYKDDKPVCVWYTVAVVNSNCESDLLTLPEYRGKGLATILGVNVLKTCVERGINMDWDVFTDNVPSIKIAERFGKKSYFVYNFLSIFKNI